MDLDIYIQFGTIRNTRLKILNKWAPLYTTLKSLCKKGKHYSLYTFIFNIKYMSTTCIVLCTSYFHICKSYIDMLWDNKVIKIYILQRLLYYKRLTFHILFLHWQAMEH